MFRVYQCEINDARYHEVNAKGWGGVEWGRAYMRATSGTARGDRKADDLVTDALLEDLYTHTKTVYLENMEKVFEVLNIGSDYYDEIVDDFQRSKSMSVGDVLVDQAGNGWYYDSCGFVKLDAMTVRVLQASVVTHVKVA